MLKNLLGPYLGHKSPTGPKIKKNASSTFGPWVGQYYSRRWSSSLKNCRRSSKLTTRHLTKSQLDDYFRLSRKTPSLPIFYTLIQSDKWSSDGQWKKARNFTNCKGAPNIYLPGSTFQEGGFFLNNLGATFFWNNLGGVTFFKPFYSFLGEFTISCAFFEKISNPQNVVLGVWPSPHRPSWPKMVNL